MMRSSEKGCGLVTGEGEDNSDDEGPPSCCSLLFLVALFFLQVASISRSKGTRLFPHIHKRNKYRASYHRIKIETNLFLFF